MMPTTLGHNALARCAMVVPNETVVGDAQASLQARIHDDPAFDYCGPRSRSGIAFNLVDPPHARLLAAVQASKGSLFVNEQEAAPFFVGIAKHPRKQDASDHGQRGTADFEVQ